MRVPPAALPAERKESPQLRESLRRLTGIEEILEDKKSKIMNINNRLSCLQALHAALEQLFRRRLHDRARLSRLETQLLEAKTVIDLLEGELESWEGVNCTTPDSAPKEHQQGRATRTPASARDSPRARSSKVRQAAGNHVTKMSRNINQVFEEFQRARSHFVQTVADLAQRPQNIDGLRAAGALRLLRPLLLDSVPGIQQTAAVAVGRLVGYSEDAALECVKEEILPHLVASVAQQNVSISVASDICQHTLVLVSS
ncbi:hypothetical protein Efla_001125 [Eimeria flavescens]